ncbi:hypothetical protein ACSLBF_15335 [Pseudoalteromonas sp. T1lg65]|uniref:hypothetical protein n=1 Tax=Pseudoalteromonas sp. T1lg65 TaxID=2077101 RepID=UPI003F79AC67
MIALARSLFCFVSLGIIVNTAQAAMPKSQIWLANWQDEFTARSLTPDDAYYNQPLVTEKGVYFTQEVKQQAQSQTDIFFYDYQTQQAINLTESDTSEYSPTLHPSGKGLSLIVVEADGAQKLWFYPFDKSQPRQRVFDHIAPVGYHAWGQANDIIMFILGANEYSPHTLQYTKLSGHLPQVIAEDIGRTLAFNPSLSAYSFTYKVSDKTWFATYDPKKDLIQRHFALPEGVQDYVWLDDSKVLYALDNRVYYREIDSPKQVHLFRNLKSYCQTKITRLSVQGDSMAFVCQVKD